MMKKNKMTRKDEEINEQYIYLSFNKLIKNKSS
jgi:hypothetical protein